MLAFSFRCHRYFSQIVVISSGNFSCRGYGASVAWLAPHSADAAFRQVTLLMRPVGRVNFGDKTLSGAMIQVSAKLIRVFAPKELTHPLVRSPSV
jgi:hypothetical protein